MTTASRSVCVFCGSRYGSDPAWRGAAEDLGRGIAEAGWQLVYGAGDVGLMGAVANAAQAGGADTLGVIPIHLLSHEKGRRDLTRFVVTENMHERKKVMFMNSDAIVVLPGGAGTLDEFFEVLTWRQLGLHAKPIHLLNVAGYWDPLLRLIDSVIATGFAEPSLRAFVEAPDTVAACLSRLGAQLS
ncbi:TIGR00730 family Rossman fold protein [Palleronia sp. KMU-117]|uniref:LOG family protein n=1 Tax=Palleronia sp. KMU-117 TaxID=3434108 RepID=UPI003D7294F3